MQRSYVETYVAIDDVVVVAVAIAADIVSLLLLEKRI